MHLSPHRGLKTACPEIASAPIGGTSGGAPPDKTEPHGVERGLFSRAPCGQCRKGRLSHAALCDMIPASSTALGSSALC